MSKNERKQIAVHKVHMSPAAKVKIEELAGVKLEKLLKDFKESERVGNTPTPSDVKWASDWIQQGLKQMKFYDANGHGVSGWEADMFAGALPWDTAHHQNRVMKAVLEHPDFKKLASRFAKYFNRKPGTLKIHIEQAIRYNKW